MVHFVRCVCVCEWSGWRRSLFFFPTLHLFFYNFAIIAFISGTSSLQRSEYHELHSTKTYTSLAFRVCVRAFVCTTKIFMLIMQMEIVAVAALVEATATVETNTVWSGWNRVNVLTPNVNFIHRSSSSPSDRFSKTLSHTHTHTHFILIDLPIYYTVPSDYSIRNTEN